MSAHATTRRAALALGGAAMLSVTMRDARSQSPRTMTFVTPFSYILAFADVLNAQGGGFFAREGLDVTIQQGRGSAMAVQQIVGGGALLSRTGVGDHIRASSRPGGDDLVAVGTISQGSPFYVISAPDKPVRTPADMAGKTIGVLSVGGATEIVLDVMLQATGVERARVARQVAPNSPAGLQLIAQGRIDAYIVSAGVPVALQAANTPHVSWNTDDVAPIPGQCYIARRSTLAANGDIITRFLRAVKLSLDAMLADTDLSQTLANLRGFEIAEMRNATTAPLVLRNEMQFWLTAGRENMLRNVPERWQRGYDLMAAAGFAPAGVKAETLYTNEFVERALA
ncbi:ABC transporter substrate-binding protein [Falsiroseomonas sp.]|uniref:ABC transporter substrate-binding protein n=1 Tax=Falsiroseomonas sp. TaxID=2870721 RepID=UPI00272855BD|nr:ABC transporter substrate-binding protein [Falsiroseomonas sp.]MDO9502039.1 ABC transporter substrate-binding protein [Falsiroseomonas sp.]MDP3416079.1 ABC transporter substrate-binding protein [Falsiroseomonas sp.]